MKDKIRKNVNEVVTLTADGIEKATAKIADLNKQGTEVVRGMINKSADMGAAVAKPIQDVIVSTAHTLNLPEQMINTPIDLANKAREVAREGAMKTLDTVNTAIDLGARQVESVTQMAKAAAKPCCNHEEQK